MSKEHDPFLDETCAKCESGKYKIPSNGHVSYVECDNCGAIHLTYIPQDYQMDFHETPYTRNEFGGLNAQILSTFGGYGSGKSRASLSEFLLRALENPSGTGLFLAQTLQQLKKATLKTWFNEVCPPMLIANYNKSEGEITLVNGFIIYTMASDDDEKLRSMNIGLVHMEEASGIKESIFAQLLSRLRDPFTYNRTIFVCSNPEQTWIKTVLVDNEKRKDPKHPEHDMYNPYVYCYIWATELNKYLPPDFIEMNTKGKPDWFIRKYFYGSFEAVSGAVYPNFASCSIDPLTVVEGTTDKYGIPKNWERFVTLDHGLRNPTAVYFHAIDPEKGIVYTYNEYYKPETLVPQHVKNIKPLLQEIPLGRTRFQVADPSIANKTDPVNGKSVQGLYQEHGIFWSMGNNNIEAGILKVNAYIELGKWKVYNTCVNLIREGLNYKYKELDIDSANETLDEKPIKANDHAMDSCRYGFMRLPDDPALLITESAEPSYRSIPKYEIQNEFQWQQPSKHEDVEDEYQEFSDYMDYV